MTAEEIGLAIYPPKWIDTNGTMGVLRIDNNASLRAVAVEVAQFFMDQKEGCAHTAIGLCDSCIDESVNAQ